MSKSWMTLLLLPLALGCATTANSSDRQSSAPAQCEVRVHDMSGGKSLEGVVREAPGRSGSYDVAFEKLGSAGSSTVNQNGDFVVPSSGEVAVSRTDINLAPGDTYHLSMTVRDETGKTICAL